MSEAPTAVGYAFEQLEPSDPPARDAPARMIAQAKAEADGLREQARTEGYAEGRRAGEEQAASEIDRALHALGDALRGVESLRSEVAVAVERDAIELALELAGKILEGAQAVREETVLEVVQGALRRVGDRREIVVLVNPADHLTMSVAIDQLALRDSGVDRCELRSEERVEPGAAIVRSAEGEVDASVATQLQRAREVVEASLAPAESAA
ncbi:MAG: FliH/SctL family protein [Solirubrobacteraceae bacterium]